MTTATTSGIAKTRITWLRKDILRSYDVDDYVQTGLAISRASQSRRGMATNWCGLSVSGRRATRLTRPRSPADTSA